MSLSALKLLHELTWNRFLGSRGHSCSQYLLKYVLTPHYYLFEIRDYWKMHVEDWFSSLKNFCISIGRFSVTIMSLENSWTSAYKIVTVLFVLLKLFFAELNRKRSYSRFEILLKIFSLVIPQYCYGISESQLTLLEKRSQ